MAGEINKDPFFVIDDSGSLQNLKVVTRGSGSDARVLPYSLAELVSSSVTIENFGNLTSSINDIKDIIEAAHTSSYNFATASFSASLDFLTSSYSASQEFLTASFSASYEFATASFSASLEFATASFSASYDILTASYHTATASYSQLTASHDYITGSHEQLTQSNTNLVNISSSIEQTYNYLTSSLETITSNITQSVAYLKQISSYARATLVSSSIFSIEQIGEGLDLATTALIPNLIEPNLVEQYLNSCVDVLIQNNTDKKCYIKIIHDAGASVSPTDYTIVLPPGVIYNSESQLASMRHVIYVTSSAGTGSEVSAMMTYNTKLLDDPLFPELVLPNTIKSLAVNFYNIPDANPVVVNEWSYSPASNNTKLVIVGQARITSSPSEQVRLYVTKDNAQVGTDVTITSVTPELFRIDVDNAEAGHYEFMADSVGGFLATGNARVLFADLLISGSV
jgi:hypothetical protein